MSSRISRTTQARRFSVVLSAILLGLAALSLWRDHGTRAAVWAGAAALPPLLAWAVTPLWMSLFDLWMKLAEVLSWLMTRVILTVFHLLVLTPVGAFRRIVLRRDSLDLRWKEGRASYWIVRDAPDTDLERAGKPF